jgi:hypothetical protein
MRRIAGILAAAAAFAGTAASAAPAGYPTEALADYVFGCMATNGQTPDALRRCSCSIDHIASKLSYDEYTQAETVLRLQQVRGAAPNVSMFRSMHERDFVLGPLAEIWPDWRHPRLMKTARELLEELERR